MSSSSRPVSGTFTFSLSQISQKKYPSARTLSAWTPLTLHPPRSSLIWHSITFVKETNYNLIWQLINHVTKTYLPALLTHSYFSTVDQHCLRHRPAPSSRTHSPRSLKWCLTICLQFSHSVNILSCSQSCLYHSVDGYSVWQVETEGYVSSTLTVTLY